MVDIDTVSLYLLFYLEPLPLYSLESQYAQELHLKLNLHVRRVQQWVKLYVNET